MLFLKSNQTDKHNRDTETVRRDLGLYLHIPFCVKKCDYCDFLSGPATEETKKRYLEALITEIKSYKGKTEEYLVQTIFVGGGTPSSVDSSFINDIMCVLKEVFIIKGINDKTVISSSNNSLDIAEITIEINPGTITRDKLEAYKSAGINRLSFGLQSADNNELKLLGRIHTYEQFVDNYKLAREVGFKNINIDLMSALPGQNCNSWKETLEKIVELNPEHISAYSLIIEEETPFYEQYGNKISDKYKLLPSEETDRFLYTFTKDYLKRNGYQRYEISNYAKDGYASLHNCSYWTGTEYLGLGLGASSYLQHTRFQNLNDLDDYIKLCNRYNVAEGNIMRDHIGLRREVEVLTQKDQMEEFMFLGLRMSDGIRKNIFYKKFNQNIEQVYGDIIEQLKEEKLIIIDGNRICLTDYGIDVSNTVLAKFLIE